MKTFKSHKKSLLAMIAMSITCACASTAYAEINERPKFDATYDDKVVLDYEWQISPDEYTGAEKRKYTFNKGLTVSPNVSYTGNAIYLYRNIDVDFELGNGSEMNLESSDGALEVNTNSKLTINGGNSNLYFGNKKWDEYNDAATIYMDEGSKLEINAGNLTTSGGAETNLKLFDNAQAKINLTGNFISDAGGTAIAMENDYRNSDTSLSIQATNITLGTTDLETADRKAGLYLLAYREDGDNKLSVDLHAKDTLSISGFAKGIQTFGNALINLQGKTIIISAESDSQGRGLSLNSYDAAKPSILKAKAENLSIKGSEYAIYANDRVDAQLNATGDINISSSNYAISANKNTDIQLKSGQNLNILSDTWGIVSFDSTVNAQAEKAINIRGKVWTSGGHITVGKDSSTLQTVINGDLTAKNNGYITAFVNNAGSSFTGNTTDAHWQDVTTRDAGNKGIHLTLNNGSVWNDFDYDSTIQVLDTSKAKVDMQDDKFKGLFIGILKGDKSTFNMDIDAGTNTNNSDRLYIAGTHTGNHYITLNNVNADGNTDGAAGTVLVSVKDEQGNFFANDKEGSLYWNKYTLDMQDSATDGYTKDWYLKKVEFIPSKPTTSVDAVDATQRLAFANWVEDDKLMQRMGDLRHETNNEEGVWVRVKGGKYSGDGFSNRHTMYQLGYDDVVKNTDKLKRYQGVAFSYDDGKNSFNRGSGKLKAKSIGFYNTDLRNKGHYLDVVFKIYDADSDFTVFDSEGKKITGAFDNTGISLSAEYGRKKYLDEHWSIEPQAQLTLGYLGGARYTTSNGIHVSQSDPNSVLGRIGCNFMYDMDEKNTIYLKANWLHQFAGNYGVTLTNGNDSLRIDNHDHDTWFEYGLGFACMTGKNNHLYADVERSTGGSLRKNWQWNAGMRWSF
ncbi:autotransporter outer membrane beta-barrel domain-containing protein [uncultured Phascolarctobacterium sp.]|uniref:autotransporter family protein n=1 Tax=uncultured Phascolarctobacterium sp. TaxID=512296 RepID=UPI002603733F|nr:autotransporter outer membrane beta-barrel domain-containing protein [uncultured Phascolarctobacterium sp.]